VRVTSMEYGLIAVLIAVAGIAVGVVGNQLSLYVVPVPNFPVLHHGYELHGDLPDELRPLRAIKS
jgi:hypothetical protein